MYKVKWIFNLLIIYNII